MKVHCRIQTMQSVPGLLATIVDMFTHVQFVNPFISGTTTNLSIKLRLVEYSKRILQLINFVAS